MNCVSPSIDVQHRGGVLSDGFRQCLQVVFFQSLLCLQRADERTHVAFPSFAPDVYICLQKDRFARFFLDVADVRNIKSLGVFCHDLDAVMLRAMCIHLDGQIAALRYLQDEEPLLRLRQAANLFLLAVEHLHRARVFFPLRHHAKVHHAAHRASGEEFPVVGLLIRQVVPYAHHVHYHCLFFHCFVVRFLNHFLVRPSMGCAGAELLHTKPSGIQCLA